MRKLSQIPATNLGEVVPGQAYGLRAYDALAYDKVSKSPCKSGRTRDGNAIRNASLLKERYNADPNAGITCVQPYNAAAVRHVLAGGVHPAYNYRDWLVANSLNNILLPSAANDLCPQCGLTVTCKCHTPKRHTKDAPQPRVRVDSGLVSNKPAVPFDDFVAMLKRIARGPGAKDLSVVNLTVGDAN